MNSWMEDFISQCLADVPQGKYYERAGKELRDHLESRCQALIRMGTPPQEARLEVLHRMGNPDRLRQAYQAAWQRTFQARAARTAHRFGVIAGGCLLMGTLYICTALFLSLLGFTSDAVYLEPHTLTGRNFTLQGSRLALAVFGCSVFLVPFPLGALYLRTCFRRERGSIGWVTLGLLAAWAGEKAVILSLSAWIYDMPLGLALLNRISRGGDVTGPWFTPGYIVLTLAGCLLLGQLFGQRAERGGELA